MATARCILDGMSLSRNSSTIPYIVSGLKSNDINRMAEIYQAKGIPRLPIYNNEIGEIHPVRNDLAVEDIIVQKVYGDYKALVHVIYGRIPFPETGPVNTVDEIRFDVQAIQEETEFDASGKPIKVKFDFKSKDPKDPGECGKKTQGALSLNPEFSGEASTKPKSSSVIQCQVAKAPVYVPLGTLYIRRRERDFPLNLMFDLAGKVNSDAFFANEPGCWLAAGGNILSQNKSGSQTICEYTFLIRPEGWLQTVAYIIPETGRPPVLDKPPFEKRDKRPYLTMPNKDFQKYANGYTMVRVQGNVAFSKFKFNNISLNIK